MNKIGLILFLILFFIQGCLDFTKPVDDLISLELKIYHEWLYAHRVLGLQNNDQMIEKPLGVESLILTLKMVDDGGVKIKTHCLYYRVPYKKIIGVLKILELKSDSSCPESPVSTSWLELIAIKNLKLKLENFKLSLSFSHNEKNIVWTFLLPNLNAGIIHEKYQAARDNKLFPNLSLLRINEESFEESRSLYVGKINDHFSNGSAHLCYQVNKNCQEVLPDKCDECRFGWYQVVDYQCPRGGSRYCGQNHCGEKGEPACPRGESFLQDQEPGICQSDLSPVWNGDHLLICQ